MKNILVFGSTGMLGKELSDYLQHKVGFSDVEKVVLVPRNSVEIFVQDPDTIFLCEKEIKDFIRNKFINDNITHVVNCVAATDTRKIEDSQEERAKSFALNALFPKCLAKTCAEFGIKLVHISTDYVYSEHLVGDVCPITYYGTHKLMGELFVKNALSYSYQIVRVGWLYGTNREKSFVHKIISACAKAKRDGKDRIQVVDDQWGTPTSCRFATERIAALIDSQFEGTVATAPDGSCTRAEFAVEILKNLDKITSEFKDMKVERIPESIATPKDTVLSRTNCNFIKPDGNPTWREDLMEYMENHADEFKSYVEKVVSERKTA